ncbi:MAG: GNAT family N-acetyltransferase [Burkholderiales bacterium]|nr:GNAT family N-acetyltransferase [Burkholderiales bacterium]
MPTDANALQLCPADAVAPERLHAAFVAAFADYLAGPFELPPAAWPQFLARQGVELPASRVALRNGELLAFALVAPRPAWGRWRLATMGALPAARGGGAAPALLDDFLARARAAGQQAVELEVFAQNERALRLYQGRGFEAHHRLRGWRLAVADWPGPVPAVQVPPLEAAWGWLHQAEQALPELPLQVTPAVLARASTRLQAWQHGCAQIVFSAEPGAPVRVHSLVDRHPAQQDAQRLLEALMSRYRERELQVPQLQRDDLGGEALARLGFEALPLYQWWMRRDLARGR